MNPAVSCGKLARLDPDGLDRAGPSMVERQVDRGRDPPIGEERQPVDQFLVDLDDVSAGRLHLIHGRQCERVVEGDALACRAHRVSLRAELGGTVPGDLTVALRGARHCGPAVLHHEVAPVPGRGSLDRLHALGELRIALRLIDADQGQRRNDISFRLVGRHGAGRAAGHPAAPGKPPMASAIAPQAAPYSPGFSHSGVCMTFLLRITNRKTFVIGAKNITQTQNYFSFIFANPSNYLRERPHVVVEAYCKLARESSSPPSRVSWVVRVAPAGAQSIPT